MAVYVEKPRVAGEDRKEGTWARDLGRREAEANEVSTRRDMAKESLVKQTTQLYKQNPENNLCPTKPNVHNPLKTVLNTTRKYTFDLSSPEFAEFIYTQMTSRQNHLSHFFLWFVIELFLIPCIV